MHLYLVGVGDDPAFSGYFIPQDTFRGPWTECNSRHQPCILSHHCCQHFVEDKLLKIEKQRCTKETGVASTGKKQAKFWDLPKKVPSVLNFHRI
jgi:hypothetical protein